jgi:acetyl esterase/lipase
MEPLLYKYARHIRRKIAGRTDRPKWEHDAPDGIIEEFNVTYTGRDGNDLHADIYRPKEYRGQKLPVIVMLHGGGLFIGSPVVNRDVCELLAGKGYLVFAPSYRLMDEADAPGEISDICAALDFAAGSLEERGDDPDTVFMIAESAGAFLGLYAAAAARSPELGNILGCSSSRLDLKALAFVSGMFYTTKKNIIGLLYPKAIYGELRNDKTFMSYMDPDNRRVAGCLPPAILTSSRADPLKKASKQYYRALTAAGNKCRLLYYGQKDKKLTHAFVTLKPYLPESKDALEKICEWFEASV